MKNNINKVLIIGLGNVLMRDDGIGVEIIKRLKKESIPEEVEIVEVGTGIFNFVEEISRTKNLIIVDALKGDNIPGTIYRFSLKNIKNNIPSNMHDITILDIITMARDLNSLPDNVIIFGIEPKKISPGNFLSRAVEISIPKLIKKIKEETKELLL